jgi:hypothetical protein
MPPHHYHQPIPIQSAVSPGRLNPRYNKVQDEYKACKTSTEKKAAAEKTSRARNTPTFASAITVSRGRLTSL